MIKRMPFSEIRPGDAWMEGRDRLTAITVTPVDINYIKVTFTRETSAGSHMETSNIRSDLVWDLHRPEPEATKEELDEAKQGLESWLQ